MTINRGLISNMTAPGKRPAIDGSDAIHTISRPSAGRCITYTSRTFTHGARPAAALGNAVKLFVKVLDFANNAKSALFAKCYFYIYK